MPESQLREHYRELESEAFAPISIIGDATDLSQLNDDSVDFVIANHLVEHIDNPIRGINEMVRVLRPHGVLYIALPDPRATFDFERQPTTVEHLLRDYREGPQASKEGHFLEWVEKVEPHTHFGEAVRVKERVQALLAMDYSIHYHVWRPDTFMDFLSAARKETGMELEMVDFAPCDQGNDNEFIFVFMKGILELPVRVPPLPGQELELPAPPHPGDGPRQAPAAGPAHRLKLAVKRSAAGPILKPIYLAGKRLIGR